MVSGLDLNEVDNIISTLASDNAAEVTPIGFEDYMHLSKARLADDTKEPFLVVDEDSPPARGHRQLARHTTSLLSLYICKTQRDLFSVLVHLPTATRGSGRPARLDPPLILNFGREKRPLSLK